MKNKVFEFSSGDKVWLYNDNDDVFLGVVEEKIAGKNIRYRLKINKSQIWVDKKEYLVDANHYYDQGQIIRHHKCEEIIEKNKGGDGLSVYNSALLPHQALTLPDVLFHYFLAVNTMNYQGRKTSTQCFLVPFSHNSFLLKCPQLPFRKMASSIFSEKMINLTRNGVSRRIQSGIDQSLIFLGDNTKKTSQTFQQYSMMFVHRDNLNYLSATRVEQIKSCIDASFNIIGLFGSKLGLKDPEEQHVKILTLQYVGKQIKRIQLRVRAFEALSSSRCSLSRTSTKHSNVPFEIFHHIISNQQLLPFCHLFDGINKYQDFKLLQLQYKTIPHNEIQRWMTLMSIAEVDANDIYRTISACLMMHNLHYDEEGLLNIDQNLNSLNIIQDLLKLSTSSREMFCSVMSELNSRNTMIQILYSGVLTFIVDTVNVYLDELMLYNIEEASVKLNLIQVPDCVSNDTTNSSWQGLFSSDYVASVRQVALQYEHERFMKEWQRSGVEAPPPLKHLPHVDHFSALSEMVDFDISRIESTSSIIQGIIFSCQNMESPSTLMNRNRDEFSGIIGASHPTIFHCIDHDFCTANDPHPSQSQFNRCLKQLRRTGFEDLLIQFREWPVFMIDKFLLRSLFPTGPNSMENESPEAPATEDVSISDIFDQVDAPSSFLTGLNNVYLSANVIPELTNTMEYDSEVLEKGVRFINEKFSHFCSPFSDDDNPHLLVENRTSNKLSPIVDLDVKEDVRSALVFKLLHPSKSMICSEDLDSEFDLSDDEGDQPLFENYRTNTYKLITTEKLQRCKNQMRDCMIGNCLFDQYRTEACVSEIDDNEVQDTEIIKEKFNEKEIDLVLDMQVVEDGLFSIELSHLLKIKLMSVLKSIKNAEMITDDDATDFITKCTLLIEKLMESPTTFSPKVIALIGEISKALLILIEPSELYFNKQMKVLITRSRCLYLFFVNKLFNVLLKLFRVIVDTYEKERENNQPTLHLLLYTITTIIEYSTNFNDETRKYFCVPYQHRKRLLVWTLVEAFGAVLIAIQVPGLNIPIFHFVIDKLQSAITSCISSHELELKRDIVHHQGFKNRSPARKSITKFFYNVIVQDETLSKKEKIHNENDVLFSRIIQITCLALKSETNESILGCLRMITKLLYIFEKHPDVHHVIREMICQIPLRSSEYAVYSLSLLQSIDKFIELTVSGRKHTPMDYATNHELTQNIQKLIEKLVGNDRRQVFIALFRLCKSHKVVFQSANSDIMLFNNNLVQILSTEKETSVFIDQHCTLIKPLQKEEVANKRVQDLNFDSHLIFNSVQFDEESDRISELSELPQDMQGEDEGDLLSIVCL